MQAEIPAGRQLRRIVLTMVMIGLGGMWLVGCGTPAPASSQPEVKPSEQPAGTASAATATPAPAGDEGFAIYLTAEGLSVAQMQSADLRQVGPAETPLLSAADIVAYHRDSHTIELTAETYQRIAKLTVPTIGVPFLVCVDRRPVYWGAFWTPLSSASFPGVVIELLPDAGDHTLRLKLGYPSAKFFSGQDPRPAPEVLEALERAGKLRLDNLAKEVGLERGAATPTPTRGAESTSATAARAYLEGKAYQVLAYEGTADTYVLTQEKLVGLPYMIYWGLQTVDPEPYLGKTIQVEEFLVKNHPLGRWTPTGRFVTPAPATGQTQVFVFVVEGQAVGGTAFPPAAAGMAGGYWSLDGRTLEEVHGVQDFPAWRAAWVARFGGTSRP